MNLDHATTEAAEKAADAAGFMERDPIPGLVSVIIPTYNRRALLLEALESVAAQSYRPIEALVIDDGSTDGTAAAVEGWYRDVSPERRRGLDLKLLRQPNLGAQRARNHGLEASSGEYIQFFDSDDLLLPEKLARQVARLKANPELDFVYSSGVIIAGPGNPRASKRLGHPASMNIGGHLGGQPIQTALGLYRRATCQRIGPWNETLKVWQESEYNLRLFVQGARIGYLDGILLEYRLHCGSRVSDKFLTPSLVHSLREMASLLTEPAHEQWLVDGLECIGRQCLSLGLHAAAAGEWKVLQQAVELGESLPMTSRLRRKIAAVRLLTEDAVPGVARQAAAVAVMRLLKWRGRLRSCLP